MKQGINSYKRPFAFKKKKVIFYSKLGLAKKIFRRRKVFRHQKRRKSWSTCNSETLSHSSKKNIFSLSPRNTSQFLIKNSPYEMAEDQNDFIIEGSMMKNEESLKEDLFFPPFDYTDELDLEKFGYKDKTQVPV